MTVSSSEHFDTRIACVTVIPALAVYGFPLIHNKISGNTPKGALLPLNTYNPIITCAMRRINLAVSPKAYP